MERLEKTQMKHIMNTRPGRQAQFVSYLTDLLQNLERTKEPRTQLPAATNIK